MTAISSHGTSGILGLAGYSEAVLIRPHTNTNVLRPRTVIPTLQAKLAPGTHWLISAVYGEPGDSGEGDEAMAAEPAGDPLQLLGVELTGHEIRVATHTGQSITIPLDK